MDILYGAFIWDHGKERENIRKHGVDFIAAAEVFLEPNRRIYADEKHSEAEPRHFCVGRVGGGVLTVRLTYRGERIRILGAGFWRKGRREYEKHT